jgi:Uma2 family endonuclease
MFFDEAEFARAVALLPDPSLLYSDEPPMETTQHYKQLALLVSCLERLWADRDDFFIGANLTVYFSPDLVKSRDFRGPDFFVVRGVARRDRVSWVLWDEGRYPEIIIELLSESTADIDRGIKKEIYQDQFRTPEYFWYSPLTQEFRGFRLSGPTYQEIEPDLRGRRWSEVLGLFLGIVDERLRYFTPEGSLVPTPEEAEQQERQRAEQEYQRAEQERERAEQEHQRAEKLARYLRERGIDPDNL